MQIEELDFPILLIGKEIGSSFDIIISTEALHRVPALTIERQTLEDVFVIDSQGGQFHIEQVTRRPMSHFAWKLACLTNRTVEVDALIIKEKEPTFSLEEIQFRLIEAFKDQAFSHVWDDIGLDTKNLGTTISRYNSIPELILFFAEFYME